MEEKDKFKVLSVFSGCGGLDLGFKQAGFNIVWANEKNKDACASFKMNFPETKLIEEDIKLVKDSEFPINIDLLIGGFPCQGFSLGGTRKLNDSRNILYKEFSRCLKIVQPKMFLAENVKGLLTLANGKIFEQMVVDFAERDYNVSHQLYNAKQFGVPQDRERLILIGIRNDLDIEFNFPKIKYGQNLKPFITLKNKIWNLRNDPGEYFKGDFTSRFMSRQRKRSWFQVSYCIMASAKQNPLHPDGVKMKKVGKDKFIFQGNKNRRMSIKECLLIQSFPETFQLKGSLTSKYRQIGNAVPPLMAKEIAFQIKKTLSDYYRIFKQSSNKLSNNLIKCEIN